MSLVVSKSGKQPENSGFPNFKALIPTNPLTTFARFRSQAPKLVCWSKMEAMAK